MQLLHKLPTPTTTYSASISTHHQDFVKWRAIPDPSLSASDPDATRKGSADALCRMLRVWERHEKARGNDVYSRELTNMSIQGQVDHAPLPDKAQPTSSFRTGAA